MLHSTASPGINLVKQHIGAVCCQYSFNGGLCVFLSFSFFSEIVGVGCVLNGVRYKNGETFQPNCKYNCTCINGAVGCVPMCTNSRPPLVWCPNPKLIKMTGKCCEQWVCDDSRKIRKTSPRHISSAGTARMRQISPSPRQSSPLPSARVYKQRISSYCQSWQVSILCEGDTASHTARAEGQGRQTPEGLISSNMDLHAPPRVVVKDKLDGTLNNLI